jgi:zinc protease
LVLAIFGDIDPAKALTMITESFGSLPRSADFKLPAFRELRLEKPITASKVTRRPDTAVILLSYPTVNLLQRKENDALLVLQSIFSGYDSGSGWLFHDLRGAGLVYVVQATHHQSLATGTLAISAQTRPDQLDDALRRIKGHLAKAARGEITADEFAKVKTQIINAHARENETLAERARLAAVNECIGLGFDYEDSFEKRIESLTLDDVTGVAKKYLQNPVQVTTSPKGDVK